MTGTADVLRFALRQGPLRGLLHDPINVDERVPTTACLPPQSARGNRGRPLPLGAHELLAATPYPAGRVGADGAAEWQRVGAVLAAAFGPLRREPSNPANDHRVTASVVRSAHAPRCRPGAAPAGFEPVGRPSWSAVVVSVVAAAALPSSKTGAA